MDVRFREHCIGFCNENAIDVEVRLYDRLFTKADLNDLDEGAEFLDYVNPNSLQVIEHCKAEASLASAAPGMRYQFEREGYFVVDPDSTLTKLVFQPDRASYVIPGQKSKKPKSITGN